jgi:signal transduction histidine kinase
MRETGEILVEIGAQPQRPTFLRLAEPATIHLMPKNPDPSASPGKPAVLFWQLQALGWSGTIIISAAFALIGSFGSRDALLIGAFRALLGFSVTSFLLRPVMRAVRRSDARVLAWSGVLVLCVALGVADTLATGGVARVIDADLQDAGNRRFLTVSLVLRGLLYVLWSLLYWGINYWLETRRSLLRMARLEAEARTTELQLLRAQVNPHFLFNALNSILAEARNSDGVLAITQALADYLRFSLRQTGTLQPLGEELDALENYLRVEKVRFEERLEYAIHASEEVRRLPAPPALVQPLLENAIKFGQRTSRLPLRIEIDAKVEAGTLRITVTNTGQWIEPASRGPTGIGLANLRRRLELLAGPGARVEVFRDPDCVRVVLDVPMPAATPATFS